MEFVPVNKRQNTIGKLLLMILLSIFMGVAALVTMVAVFPWFSQFFGAQVTWSFDGYISVVSLAILIGGFTFAIYEYNNRETARQHEKLTEEREKVKLRYDIYQAIFTMLTAPEQEAARRWILDEY